MGLDVSAYSKVALVAAKANVAEDKIDEMHETCASFYVNHDFEGRQGTIVDGFYSYDDSFGFCAGSYGGYNNWREKLALLAGYRSSGNDEGHHHSQGAWDADSGPFWELINFSDCEGVIGTETCTKIAADFAKFQPLADAHVDQWFRDKYAEWRKAFELAANGGSVEFH
jgi:hypothetical protein